MMKKTRLALPLFALGTALLLFTTAKEGHGFTLADHFLGLGQRDFRVFNNFTDPEANDNQTPHPNFPGYTGATVAIWKGCVEWGSVLHGDGSGDPHQPFGLGSGGSSFNATFQGLATSVGGLSDNVFSEIQAEDFGVIAFAEGLTDNGWRARYYSNWTWDDGPDETIAASAFDLQGIAAFLYGAALGLGNSNMPQDDPTMSAFVVENGVPQRSIEPDDIAGIQAKYGPDTGLRPDIDAVTIAAGQVTVTGSGFSDVNNRLWFTPRYSDGDGDAVKVVGLVSTNGGTEIQATIPDDAGPGDILVRVPGMGPYRLSNAFPFDPGPGSCPAPVPYCTTSPNSIGPGALIATSGPQSIAENEFRLYATRVPIGQFGVFFYGPSQTDVPFGDGRLCVTGGVARLPVVSSTTAGGVTFPVDFTDPPQANAVITAGSTWFFQFWYRDPTGGPVGFNVSNAIEVAFCR